MFRLAPNLGSTAGTNSQSFAKRVKPCPHARRAYNVAWSDLATIRVIEENEAKGTPSLAGQGYRAEPCSTGKACALATRNKLIKRGSSVGAK